MPQRITDIELNRISVLLQADDKARRKQALNEILKIFFKGNESWNIEELSQIWDQLNRPLTRLLSDQTEVCRDITLEILKKFLSVLHPSDKHIVYLIPILSRRLSSEEYIEPSEEIRLKCITLLKLILSQYKDHLAVYLDDIIGILARAVRDNYPNVKKESCECISQLAKTVPRHFYSYSESLIKPILSNFTHQHYRVRVSAVKTIGEVLQYGNNKSIEDVATPLAERLFDQSGAVRAAIVEVAGSWLVNLRDRYSWWHKLLPLLLTGLHDEIQEIRMKAAEMWDATGKLYLQENENDEKLKDKMDFLTEPPSHYPPNILRPNLGCRIICQQNLCKLVNGIAHELGNWLADIRVRSAQLLCVLILNVEQDVTQHIEKLLPSMYRACNDEDKRVIDNVELAAEYIGYFVKPENYCHLVLPTLEDSPTAGHLRVLAAIIRGSERNALLPYLEKIANFLQQPHICQSRKNVYQRQILSCCNWLFTVCNEDCTKISQDMFTVIITVLSMSNEESIQMETKILLNLLTKIESLESIKNLYFHHIKPLLMVIRQTCNSWTIYNVDYQIFRTFLIQAPVAIACNMDIVLSIFEDVMNKNSDKELKLQHLILLSEHFLCNQEALKSIIDFDTFSHQILEICIIPTLVWSAGRAAEALRTASVCCLCAFLQNDAEPIKCSVINKNNQDLLTNVDENNEENLKLLSNTDMFLSTFDKVSPILVSLSNDNARKTRLYSLKAICYLMSIGQKLACLTEDNIHKVYPAVLKRLDDGSDDIRWAAVEALVQVWSAIPEDYNLILCKGHVDGLYTTVLIHLDDPEPKFQGMILEALMHLAKINPELLFQKLQNAQTNFRNQKGIEILLNHCQNILSQN